MNNIGNIISIINKNGGIASLEEILDAYVQKWHILPLDENKQKIKTTLLANEGKLVFYDEKTNNWTTQSSEKPKPAKNNNESSSTSSSAGSNIESVLESTKNKLNMILVGSEYRMERNSTNGEKNLDLFKGTGKRIGYIYPKLRTNSYDFCLNEEYYTKLYDKDKLPVATYERKSSSIRKYAKIDIETVTNILEQLKHS